MGEDLGERTEQPTTRRLEQARQRGQVAQSRDLAGAVVLLAAVVGFHYFGELMIRDAVRLMRYCLSDPWMDLGVERIRIVFPALGGMAFLAVLPWLATVLILTIAVHYFQLGGFEIASEKNYFNFAKLNPIEGAKRIFSLRGLMRTALDIAKFSLIAAIAYLYISNQVGPIAATPMMEFPTIASFAFEHSLRLAYYLLCVLILLGIADYLYQKFQHTKDLRMTRQEVKEELKDLEGDPQIKMRRRQIQYRLAQQRMIEQVPEAEVVITNPTHLAVALKYDPEEFDVPRVVAKGAGVFAKRIRELAAEHGVPVIENKPLAQLLYRTTEFGGAIPEDSYLLVAEILAYVYRITGKTIADPQAG